MKNDSKWQKIVIIGLVLSLIIVGVAFCYLNQPPLSSQNSVKALADEADDNFLKGDNRAAIRSYQRALQQQTSKGDTTFRNIVTIKLKLVEQLRLLQTALHRDESDLSLPELERLVMELQDKSRVSGRAENIRPWIGQVIIQVAEFARSAASTVAINVEDVESAASLVERHGGQEMAMFPTEIQVRMQLQSLPARLDEALPQTLVNVHAELDTARRADFENLDLKPAQEQFAAATRRFVSNLQSTIEAEWSRKSENNSASPFGITKGNSFLSFDGELSENVSSKAHAVPITTDQHVLSIDVQTKRVLWSAWIGESVVRPVLLSSRENATAFVTEWGDHSRLSLVDQLGNASQSFRLPSRCVEGNLADADGSVWVACIDGTVCCAAIDDAVLRSFRLPERLAINAPFLVNTKERLLAMFGQSGCMYLVKIDQYQPQLLDVQIIPGSPELIRGDWNRAELVLVSNHDSPSMCVVDYSSAAFGDRNSLLLKRLVFEPLGVQGTICDVQVNAYGALCIFADSSMHSVPWRGASPDSGVEIDAKALVPTSPGHGTQFIASTRTRWPMVYAFSGRLFESFMPSRDGHGWSRHAYEPLATDSQFAFDSVVKATSETALSLSILVASARNSDNPHDNRVFVVHTTDRGDVIGPSTDEIRLRALQNVFSVSEHRAVGVAKDSLWQLNLNKDQLLARRIAIATRFNLRFELASYDEPWFLFPTTEKKVVVMQANGLIHRVLDIPDFAMTSMINVSAERYIFVSQNRSVYQLLLSGQCEKLGSIPGEKRLNPSNVVVGFTKNRLFVYLGDESQLRTYSIDGLNDNTLRMSLQNTNDLGFDLHRITTDTKHAGVISETGDLYIGRTGDFRRQQLKQADAQVLATCADSRRVYFSDGVRVAAIEDGAETTAAALPAVSRLFSVNEKLLVAVDLVGAIHIIRK